jgi:uncharacterized protein (DUF58 family)
MPLKPHVAATNTMLTLTIKQKLHQQYWRLLSHYLAKKQPPSTKVTLVQKLIFILPTRYGWWFLLLIILLYLLGTNYQNNLILLVCYLLLSLFLLSIGLCYHNMSGLTIQCSQPAEGFANAKLAVVLQLSSEKQHLMLNLNLLQLSDEVLLPDNVETVSLPFTAATRGRYPLPRIKISSQYPFGLWRGWSYVALAQHYWVYPAPQRDPDPAENSSATDQPQQVLPSGDTLAPYRSGDSLRHLVWKRLARDPANPVIRQQYVTPQAEPSWVVVPAVSGEALERALRQACSRLLELEQQGKQYGVKLPHLTLAQSRGPVHLQRCLQELALC